MNCPQCGHDNPAGSERCAKCNSGLLPARTGAARGPGGIAVATPPGGTPAPGAGEATLDNGAPQGWQVRAADAGATSDLLPLAVKPGQVLGNRYEILQLLGEGGMGAVYKARDRALDRIVALKTIRPERASHPEILQRFKQELILARQVTHKNVIRIFDLGEAEGIKFITMDYIEGQDLKALMKQRGKFPPEEAIGIIQQVCRALQAAHAEGVVHRDLKPQNIMVDAQGKVSVMDFGIARSLEVTGMTQTGALMGTPDYMSPEQARGERLDARSDLFSLGIIFYELLTGKSPFAADTALSALWKRTQEVARPAIEIDPSIPPRVSEVVARCLAMERERRYASAQEILQDLDARRRPRGEAAAPARAGVAVPGVVPAPGPAPVPEHARAYWKLAGGGLVLLLVVVAGVLFRDAIFPPKPVRHAPVTLLVADFDNKTSDPVFDGTLEPMLDLALEGASFISAYNRGQARRVAAVLQPGANRLDEGLARLVAMREGISVVVPGAIAPAGKGYRVTVKAVDAATGRTIVESEEQVSSKQYMLSATGKLAAVVRKALGDTTSESAQQAAAETFTTTSMEAAHSYALGQEFKMAGKWDQAISQYTHAVQLDPDFGRAYAGLGAAYSNLGRRQEAEKYYQLAFERIDRMTEREKYRTRGAYYVVIRDQQKAIQELTALVEKFPADSSGHTNLALAYFLSRNMSKALEEGRRAIEISPKSGLQRNNVALYALYAGDFATAAREAQAALDLSPEYEKAYVARALAELGQGQAAQATQTYRKLQVTTAHGASQAATGLADLALFQGRLDEARTLLGRAIAGDVATNNLAGAADKRATLAATELALGHAAAALASAGQAAAASKDVSVVFRSARVFLEAGQEARARPLISVLAARPEPDAQAYAKLLEGEGLLKRGRPREALQLLQQGQKLADTWLGRFDLGRAYLEAAAFTEAAAEFEACLKRHGEAAAVFLDDVPSFHFFPPVYYYLGRAQEGLNNPAAADSFLAFLALKDKDSAEPLVADARRRLASR